MKKAIGNTIKTNGKKGFTLVELVIVIAILAILAAIAIPIISSAVNSAKLSAMESDSVTVETVLTAALVDYETGNKNTTYNNAPATGTTRVSDVLKENNIENIQFSRTIGGVNYYMVWKNKGLSVSNSPTNSLTSSTTLFSLKTT